VHARTSLLAVVAAFACVTTAAYAGGPGDVYNDYAQDGKLSCNHSRTALRDVLRSGSINQYGDPYTLARLKLAVRRQLAGGCRTGSQSSAARTAATGRRGAAQQRGATGGSGTNGGSGGETGKNNHAATGNRGAKRAGSAGGSSARRSASAPAPPGNGSFVSERVLIAGLLVAGLAIGGWLTRRGLVARH
jgi:cobalamin biosynthesis Mg chelatase CobN